MSLIEEYKKLAFISLIVSLISVALPVLAFYLLMMTEMLALTVGFMALPFNSLIIALSIKMRANNKKFKNSNHTHSAAATVPILFYLGIVAGVYSNYLSNLEAEALYVAQIEEGAAIALMVFMFFQVAAWIYALASSLGYFQLYKDIKREILAK